jgi:hypothetical protein
MDCILCGEQLEHPEALENHIKTHCCDKQYGIKIDPLAAALTALTVRVDKLEKARALGLDDNVYEQRVKNTADTAKRAKFSGP